MEQEVGLIGFGEAGSTFAVAGAWAARAHVFDCKTESPADRDAMLARYADAHVLGARFMEDALSGVGLVLSLVTADQAMEVAEMAAELLAHEGYKVIIAHDGFEALRIYERVGKQIGLVILDFFLPVMDGDALFDELKALNPDVNVVLSSGFAEQQKVSSMLSQGLRGFIPKPYTREKLLAQVCSTLEAAKHPLQT